MKAALIQTKQNALYSFHRPEDPISFETAINLQNQMVEQCLGMMRKTVGEGCDLIVTTEAINFCGLESMLRASCEPLIPSYPNEEVFYELAMLARQAESWLVAGLYNKRRIDCGRLGCYNSAFVYDREGQLRVIYDKIHLTETEKEYLVPGEKIVTVETDMGRMGVAVCYDMQFQDVCAGCRAAGAEFMAVPTWGWEHGYGMERIRETGLGIAAAMAVPYWMPIEGERSPSELIDGKGRILAAAGREEAQLLMGELAV